MTEHPKDIVASAAMPDLETLEAIADWRVDLTARIARTQLIFELVDFDVDFQPLADEVSDFRRVVSCLKWQGDA
jgi:hypothetical protein